MTTLLQDTTLHGTIMEIGSTKQELIMVENPPSSAERPLGPGMGRGARLGFVESRKLKNSQTQMAVFYLPTSEHKFF